MFLLSHICHGADGDVVVAHCAKVGAFAAVPVSAGHDRVFHRAVPECFAGEAVRVKIILRNGAAVLTPLQSSGAQPGKLMFQTVFCGRGLSIYSPMSSRK